MHDFQQSLGNIKTNNLRNLTMVDSHESKSNVSLIKRSMSKSPSPLKLTLASKKEYKFRLSIQ
jgi:hypothetical protein